MTAEIAIANKSAVALAADSKVTVGGARLGKTYDTVNKVFTLSKSHPVGIMIFGNAEFMSYPWETIIKMYRRERGGKLRSYVADWADDFQSYLDSFGSIEKKHKLENVYEVARSWLNEIEDRALSHCATSGTAPGSDDYNKLLIRLMTRELNRAKKAKLFFDVEGGKAFAEAYVDPMAKAVTEAVGEGADDKLNQAAIGFCATMLTRHVDSPQSSGIVVAGYGEKEFFPTIIELSTDGYIGDNIKIRKEATIDISRDKPGAMRAFAQKEMVQRFMNGVDNSLSTMLVGMFNETLRDSCLSVLEAHGLKSHKTDVVKKEIAKASRERVKTLFQDFGATCKRDFSDPVVNMITLLPKEELAHMAESLVALTSLKRRVSRDAETVGGAIDVALISKGDGFIWVKRKQYFKPDLNPQFVRRYMDDVCQGEG